MRLWRVILLISLLSATLGFGLDVHPAVYAQDDGCAERAVPSRLQIGGTARVILNGDGIGVIFRDNPGKERSGSQVIRALPEGEILTLLTGPICLEANSWWEVDLTTGERGWVSEGDVTTYFIEPYSISLFIVELDATNPRQLNRWRIDADGNIQARGTFLVPGGDAVPARDLWQEPDQNAATADLLQRRANCPEVLVGTPWEVAPTAEDVVVPEGEFDYYLSPDGGKIFLIRHRVLMMPACGSAIGRYYGVSTTHLLTQQDITDFFPYGQSSGARSKDSCLTPDVTNFSWRTELNEIVWSPDSDTVAFVARYIDQDVGRVCAYYFTFMIDIYSGSVNGIAEGRHVGWGEGGARLYYFTQQTDNGYNVLNQTFWQLGDGVTTEIGLPDGSAPLPQAFDSTGVYLPWTSDGRQILICADDNCTGVFSFDTVRRQSAPLMVTPEVFRPFEVKNVVFVAGGTRLLWLTTFGQPYLQGLQGIDSGNWGSVDLDDLGAGVTVDQMIVMPGGIHVLLQLNNGEYAILNTVSRNMQVLGQLAERTATPDDANASDTSTNDSSAP